MDPETIRLERRMIELEEENHRLLKSLHRTQQWSWVFFVFKWGIIIVLTFGTYIYVQPYLDQLLQVYSGFQGTADSIKKVGQQLPDASLLQDLLNKLKGN
mgnify:FL=1